MKRLIALALLLAAASCAPWVKIPPGKVKLADKAVVETSEQWSGIAGEEAFFWTQDGLSLDAMYFHLGVKDGKTLYEDLDPEARQNAFVKLMNLAPDKVSFKFNKMMTEYEIVEWFTTSWGKAAGDVPVKIESVAPGKLGENPGVSFEYSYADKPLGLRRRGIGAAAVVDEKLYVVHYLGAEIHQFERGRAEAERVFASVQVLKDKGLFSK